METSEVVYLLLQGNLDKLDNNFADQSCETGQLLEISEVSLSASRKYRLVTIGEFSKLIQQFPLGSKATNVEISHCRLRNIPDSLHPGQSPGILGNDSKQPGYCLQSIGYPPR